MAKGAVTPVFRQDIPGYVPYIDNGDGTFSEQVVTAPGVPAGGLVVVRQFADVAEGAGTAGALWTWIVPNDGRLYRIKSVGAVIGPTATITALVTVSIQNANTGADLAYLLKYLPVYTSNYNVAFLAYDVPLVAGEQVRASWSNPSGAALEMGAFMTVEAV